MDVSFIVAIFFLLVLGIFVIFFLKKFSSVKEEKEGPEINIHQRPQGPRGVVRRRIIRARDRGVQRNDAQVREEDEEGEQELDFREEKEELKTLKGSGKIGAKKLKKLEEKAEKKAMREAMEAEREERKQREEEREEERRQKELKKQKEEEEKEKRLEEIRLEKIKQEEEEYQKLKSMFQVEEEGVDVSEENDEQNLLHQFLFYIKETKVVMLEDLAFKFKIKTQDAINRINMMQEDSVLTGVMDDRGKFIFITKEEYEAVAKFIKQRGRVSISELSDNINILIDLKGNSNFNTNFNEEKRRF